MHISELDHLRNIPMIRFSTEELYGEKFTIVTYMVDDGTFWDVPLATEARGITFNEAGECVCRPFEKFFNLYENDSTRPEALFGSEPQMVYIQEKMDGSMLTPVLVGGRVVWKSKKSFYSFVAELATMNCPPEVEECARRFIAAGKTPIFEYMSPDNKIVMPAEKVSWTLLAARDILSGALTPFDFMIRIADGLVNIDAVTAVKMNAADVIKFAKSVHEAKNTEGVVLTFVKDSQFRKVKVKTRWYRDLHHVMTDMRERDIARMVIDGTHDDARALVIESNLDPKAFDSVVARVVAKMNEYISSVKDMAEEIRGKDPRAMFELHGHHVWYKTATQMVKNPVFDLDEAAKKYMLKNIQAWSLHTVYSDFQSEKTGVSA